MTVPGAEVTGGTAGTPFPIPRAAAARARSRSTRTGKLATVNGAAPADVTVTTPGVGQRRGGERAWPGTSSTRQPARCR